MKKSHLLALVVILVSVIVIVSTAGDASSYVTFDEARSLVDAGKANSIHVVGQLKKDKNGQFVGIEESPTKTSFRFLLVDEENNEDVVYFNNPMPNDFLKSEQVVVIGQYKNNQFVADEILLKCPSKYQEETIEFTAAP